MGFTERSSTSWFGRLKSAVSGIVAGFILLGIAIVGMFWNETRAVATYEALAEGAGLVVNVAPAPIDPANAGKLVHVSGAVRMDIVPEDPLSGIRAEGAIGISRQVEMYQWVENKETRTEKKLGGGEETITTYSYAKQWSSQAIDSSSFRQQSGHENPSMLISSENFVPEEGQVGDFYIAGNALANLATAQKIMADDEAAYNLASNIGSSDVMLVAGDVYLGSNPRQPQIGDMRVSYSRLDLSEASFVGRQAGDGLAAYRTSNGNEIFLSAPGQVDAMQMFADARASNAMLTWILRGFLLLAMFIGFSMIFNILTVIADIVPFFGSIIGFGVGMVAFLLTLILGSAVIAIAWFTARPVMAVIVLGIGVGLFFAITAFKKKQALAQA